ncbi:MAG: type IX secretion system membrane protein PorP/SprF, partial [Cytophagaceae bacterium]
SFSYRILANNLNELGVLQNVKRFYFDADKRIGTPGQSRYHFIGLQAYNSKFGDYIHKSRLMGRYAWYTQLSKKSSVSAGVSLGFINYSFSTTQGGTGGSDFGPDGSVGLQYLRPNTTIGIAIQQIFTPELMPVNQSFRLDRLYNLSLFRRLNIDDQFQLTTFAVIQYSDDNRYNYSFGLLSHLAKNVLLGVNNFSLRKTSVNAGVDRIKVLNQNFMFMATYSFHHHGIPLPSNTIEFSIALQK